MYFEISPVLHSKIWMILVFLELVIKDPDQADVYFIVHDNLNLKAKNSENGQRDFQKEYLPWKDCLCDLNIIVCFTNLSFSFFMEDLYKPISKNG